MMYFTIKPTLQQTKYDPSIIPVFQYSTIPIGAKLIMSPDYLIRLLSVRANYRFSKSQ
jgi:hypothetical protein